MTSQPYSSFHLLQNGSVGIVERQYAYFDEPLILRSGERLTTFQLAYETYGELSPAKDNVILICHALSGDAHVAGYHRHDSNEAPGWWDTAVGPGKMFDTNRYFVICANVIGGCQGSTGPGSLAPDNKPYGLRFPIVTIQDMVNAQHRLMQRLGIPKLFAVVGGSMGGMQALQWAVEYPEKVETCIFLASTPRSTAQQIAFNEVGRQAIYADPNWNNGDYYGRGHPLPVAGLSVARMVAHITYMSELSMEAKFGRGRQDENKTIPSFDSPDFAVESYLRYQGEKFIRRFDANTYLYITKALDLFDVSHGYSSMHAALDRTRCPFLLVSFTSDWLYTLGGHLELMQTLMDLRRPVEHQHVESHFGHDSFLVEVELMRDIVGSYLNNRWKRLHPQTERPNQGLNGRRVGG